MAKRPEWLPKVLTVQGNVRGVTWTNHTGLPVEADLENWLARVLRKLGRNVRQQVTLTGPFGGRLDIITDHEIVEVKPRAERGKMRNASAQIQAYVEQMGDAGGSLERVIAVPAVGSARSLELIRHLWERQGIRTWLVDTVSGRKPARRSVQAAYSLEMNVDGRWIPVDANTWGNLIGQNECEALGIECRMGRIPLGAWDEGPEFGDGNHRAPAESFVMNLNRMEDYWRKRELEVRKQHRR